MENFKTFFEANNIRLLSWDVAGNIKFLVNNSVRHYYNGDGYWLRQYVQKYRSRPDALLKAIEKMNLPVEVMPVNP